MTTIVEAIATEWLPERISRWLKDEAEGYIGGCLKNADEDGPGRAPDAVQVLEHLLDQYPASLTMDAYCAIIDIFPGRLGAELDAHIHDITTGVIDDEREQDVATAQFCRSAL